MFTSFSKSLYYVLAASSLKMLATAQLTHETTSPATAWTSQGGEMGEGNGLFMSPDGAILAATSIDGSLQMLDPSTGDVIANYAPSSMGFSVRGFGGATFCYHGSASYVVYAIVDDADNSVSAATRVIALTTSGQKIFESDPLPGIAAGTPRTSYDCRYVLINTNEGGAIGHFNILDVSSVTDANNPLAATYQQTSNDNPFSPIGYYHRPLRGNYQGGRLNFNDLFVWGYDTPSNSTVVGDGQMFGYQMSNNGTEAGYFPLGGPQTFQSSNPPVLTYGGLSLYWSVTRSMEACWFNTSFDHSRTNEIGYTRGEPPYIAARAPPTLSSDPIYPNIFGPSAANQIWKASYDLTPISVYNTSATVSSRVAISPDDEVIYFADTSGGVYALTSENLDTNWVVTGSTPIEADIAVSNDGTTLYTGDSTGLITAYTVASGTLIPPSYPVFTSVPEATSTFNPIIGSQVPSQSPTTSGQIDAEVRTAAPTVYRGISSTAAPFPSTGSATFTPSRTPLTGSVPAPTTSPASPTVTIVNTPTKPTSGAMQIDFHNVIMCGITLFGVLSAILL